MVSALSFFGFGKPWKAVFEGLLMIRCSLIFSAVPVLGSVAECQFEGLRGSRSCFGGAQWFTILDKLLMSDDEEKPQQHKQTHINMCKHRLVMVTLIVSFMTAW